MKTMMIRSVLALSLAALTSGVAQASNIILTNGVCTSVDLNGVKSPCTAAQLQLAQMRTSSIVSIDPKLYSQPKTVSTSPSSGSLNWASLLSRYGM